MTASLVDESGMRLAVLGTFESALLTQSPDGTRDLERFSRILMDCRMGRYKDYRGPKRRGYDDDYTPRTE